MIMQNYYEFFSCDTVFVHLFFHFLVAFMDTDNATIDTFTSNYYPGNSTSIVPVYKCLYMCICTIADIVLDQLDFQSWVARQLAFYF